MKVNWKFMPLVLLSALLVAGAGCSGINATGSASPASFFLPGLLKADPPASPPDSTLPVNEPAPDSAPS